MKYQFGMKYGVSSMASLLITTVPNIISILKRNQRNNIMFTDSALSNYDFSNIKLFVLSLLIVGIALLPVSQLFAQNDNTLTYSEYLKIVIEEHPIIKTAELNTD